MEVTPSWEKNCIANLLGFAGLFEVLPPGRLCIAGHLQVGLALREPLFEHSTLGGRRLQLGAQLVDLLLEGGVGIERGGQLRLAVAQVALQGGYFGCRRGQLKLGILMQRLVLCTLRLRVAELGVEEADLLLE